MKKLLLLISIAVVIFSCEKEKEKRDILIDDAPLHIYPAPGVKSESNPEHLSAVEIVKQSDAMFWKNDILSSTRLTLSFAENQKDIITPKFIYWADYVINPLDTTITPEFIYGYDLVMVRRFETSDDPIFDTIAYMPNSIMREAERLVTEAFNKKDYLTCYEIFDSLYVFRPITGEEWRALED